MYFKRARVLGCPINVMDGLMTQRLHQFAGGTSAKVWVKGVGGGGSGRGGRFAKGDSARATKQHQVEDA